MISALPDFPLEQSEILYRYLAAVSGFAVLSRT